MAADYYVNFDDDWVCCYCGTTRTTLEYMRNHQLQCEPCLKSKIEVAREVVDEIFGDTNQDNTQ